MPDSKHLNANQSARVAEETGAETDSGQGAEFQTRFAALSRALFSAEFDEMDRLMDTGLSEICVSYGFDRGSVWWLDRTTGVGNRSHEWAVDGRSTVGEMVPLDIVPWGTGHLLEGDGRPLHIMEDVPEHAHRDREFYRVRGVKSGIFVPILINDTCAGVATFATLEREAVWLPRAVSEIQLLVQLLGNAWIRHERERQVRANAEELQAALAEIEALKDRLQAENMLLKEEVRAARGFESIVGDSAALKGALVAAAKAAPTDVTVLILGETGTGKELVARAIHGLSERSNSPLISVNCAALSVDLIESELFGHEAGAFTGADKRRKGRFELAHGGTLFLDEIGDLPLDVQARLLRVLQSGEFERLGGGETLTADVRVIAATNRNLRPMMERGEFRADLYYRINSFPVELPPLRQRPEDIPALANHFVNKYAQELGKEIRAISEEMICHLCEQQWPGNVRELEGVIQRALISSSGPVLDYRPFESRGMERSVTLFESSEPHGRMDLNTMQRNHIREVLESCNWVIAGDGGAAAVLGMPPSSLRSRMKRLGISRPH